ncbi:MAG: hypothetical protein NC120_12280 [Ruminococcus sp.]|nr:hypothetical protein [Ruminococcus sp.]
MNISDYETVPFTKDYYEELSPEETAKVLKIVKIHKKEDIKYAVELGVRAVFMIAVAVIILKFLKFNISDLSGTVSLPAGTWYAARIVVSVVTYGGLLYIFITDCYKTLKGIKDNEFFYIAKGTVLKINTEEVNPEIVYEHNEPVIASAYHFNGIKVTMDIAVSDTEKISYLDISYY